VQALFERACHRFGDGPAHLSQVVLGAGEAGEQLAKDKRIAVVSATGSTRMGQALGPAVAGRLGRALLELGGNNAMIVCPSAKRDLALRAITFAAVGTAGQRCTSLRRLFVHDSIYDTLVPALKTIYANLPIGDPLAPETLVGPLIDRAAFENMERALATARDEGGKVTGGGRVLAHEFPNAYYVRPAIAEMPGQSAVVMRETFAPILYVIRYTGFDDALALHNAVPQGLSSCIFTRDLQEAETFLSATGSDCGIANVNIGPSGAEIGGAFGGEKETGGGRESGSDAWKAYMRRQTATVNYSDALPLAQGIEFEVI
jgi:aldehyde dehydrogenase (NAD+)